MATITICDICGKKENVHRIQYPYDRQPDPAGGSEEVCETYDLCEKDELRALNAAIRVMLKSSVVVTNGYIFNTLVIRQIKRLIAKAKE